MKCLARVSFRNNDVVSLAASNDKEHGASPARSPVPSASLQRQLLQKLLSPSSFSLRALW